MTSYETAIKHVADGTTYSWDLTVLMGLGIAIPDQLREKLLCGKTGLEDASYIVKLYSRKQVGR